MENIGKDKHLHLHPHSCALQVKFLSRRNDVTTITPRLRQDCATCRCMELLCQRIWNNDSAQAAQFQGILFLYHPIKLNSWQEYISVYIPLCIVLCLGSQLRRIKHHKSRTDNDVGVVERQEKVQVDARSGKSPLGD
jgi:hypothetical protein